MRFANSWPRADRPAVRTYVAFGAGDDGRALIPLGTVVAASLSVARVLARLRWRSFGALPTGSDAEPCGVRPVLAPRLPGAPGARGQNRMRHAHAPAEHRPHAPGTAPPSVAYVVRLRRASTCRIHVLLTALARDGAQVRG